MNINTDVSVNVLKMALERPVQATAEAGEGIEAVQDNEAAEASRSNLHPWQGRTVDLFA